MNEYQFLEALDKALMELSQAEREEVLDDYRQHFRDGRANGKTDQEIAAQLGDPGLAARQYLADRQEYFHYPYAPKKPQKKSWLRWVAGGAALVAAIGIGLAAATMPRYNYASDDVPIDTVTFSSLDVTEEAGSGYQVLFEDMFSNVGVMATEIVDAAMGAVTVNTTDDIKDISFADNYDSVEIISVEVSYRVSCHLVPWNMSVVSVEIGGQIPTAHDIDVSLSNSGKLSIKYNHNKLYADANTDTPAQVIVFVPMDWMGEVTLVTIAGDIFVEDGGAVNNLEAVTASGNISVRQTDWTMEKLEAITASGDVTLAVSAEKVQVAGTSGRVDADLTVEKAEIATVSGTVDVTLRWVDSKLEVATVSGDVTVVMPQGYGYEFNTVSGSVANLSGFSYGSQVQVATVSGNLSVQPLPQSA